MKNAKNKDNSCKECKDFIDEINKIKGSFKEKEKLKRKEIIDAFFNVIEQWTDDDEIILYYGVKHLEFALPLLSDLTKENISLQDELFKMAKKRGFSDN